MVRNRKCEAILDRGQEFDITPPLKAKSPSQFASRKRIPLHRQIATGHIVHRTLLDA